MCVLKRDSDEEQKDRRAKKWRKGWTQARRKVIKASPRRIPTFLDLGGERRSRNSILGLWVFAFFGILFVQFHTFFFCFVLIQPYMKRIINCFFFSFSFFERNEATHENSFRCHLPPHDPTKDLSSKMSC